MPSPGPLFLFSLLVLLSYVEARSNWRTEFIKCSSLNYGHNTSRAIHFCGMTPLFFCCSQDNPHTNSKCCTMDDYLQELSPFYNLARILGGSALFLLFLIIFCSIYILFKSKKLLKYSHPRD